MASETAAQNQFVNANGLRIHYRDWPHPGAPALVLLHGIGLEAHSWDTFASAMQDAYRVLAVDLRGHGESDWSPDYSRQEVAEDVYRVAQELGLSRFALLGLSFGGTAAFVCAGLHPAAIERLVVVEALPEPPPAAGLQRLLTAFARIPSAVDREEEMEAVLRLYFDKAAADELHAATHHALKATAEGRFTLRSDPALFASRGMDIEAQWNLVRRITCPTLFVRGEQSDLVTPEAAARFVAAVAQGQLVEVPDASHPVPLDNPAGFLAAVRPFLLDQTIHSP